ISDCHAVTVPVRPAGCVRSLGLDWEVSPFGCSDVDTRVTHSNAIHITVLVLSCVQPNTETDMTSSTTMTIRIEPEVKAKLDRLAGDTRRSRSFLAAEAVAGYVDRELAI